MESKGGGCCIARHGASSGVYYDMSNVDRIMLRFRPIAPKPPSTGGGSVSPRDSGSTDHQVYSKPVRGKKRHVKESNNTKRKKRVLSEEKMVTLPLISETPDCCKDSIFKEKKEESFGFLNGGGSGESDDRSKKVVVRGVGSWSSSSSCVTVECVTDPWVGGDGLGCTDEERKVNLGKDTCPGFISDVMGMVTWTNGAYREMVGGGGGDMKTTTVRLMMKQRLPPVMRVPAFTCRVRVQYVCGKDMNSLTVPCDVWKMNGGGFAWRLDIAAALCLGR